MRQRGTKTQVTSLKLIAKWQPIISAPGVASTGFGPVCVSWAIGVYIFGILALREPPLLKPLLGSRRGVAFWNLETTELSLGKFLEFALSLSLTEHSCNNHQCTKRQKKKPQTNWNQKNCNCMRSARREERWTRLKPHGKLLCYLWRKSEFVTPVEGISAYYPAPFSCVLTKNNLLSKPTCNVHSQLCLFVLLLSNGFQRALKLSVSSSFFQKNIPLLLFFHSFPLYKTPCSLFSSAATPFTLY